MLSKLRKLGIVSGLSATLLLAACGGGNDNNAANNANNDAANNGGDAKYGEEMGYKITGIEAGAGVFKAAEQAIEDYDLEGWTAQSSSSGAMATELGEAIKKEEPIIVTGWSPHWKFAKYDLKYLEDPNGTFGDAETINTMVREGLEDDMPEAYALLDNFNWTPDDLEEVMLKVSEGADPAEAAEEWVSENEDKVAEWTEGIDEVDGDEIELVYVEWDTEVASTHVVGNVLESLGYKAKLTGLDNAIMWEAVASGEADGMVAAWLPGTHGDLFEEYGDKMIDLGPNLEGAKIGLVVPSYMDIDSIEDLDTK